MTSLAARAVRVLGLTALASLVLAAPTQTQCFGPDNLIGPCCQPTNLQLPDLPPFELPSLGICWKDCDPVEEVCTRTLVGKPIPVACGEFHADVTVFDCLTGAVLLKGTALLDYTRTWIEKVPSPIGAVDYQVWRFMAKVDFTTDPTSPFLPCPVASCLTQMPTAFYYGYIDYAQNCVTHEFEEAVVLYHACDWFVHNPLLSDRPGVFHPEVSYAVVAPHTPVNPFVPVILPPPGGPLLGEAMRTVPGPLVPFCIYEDPITNGNLIPLASACLCPLSLLPPQHTASVLKGQATCVGPDGLVSNFVSLNFLFPTVPWFDLISTSLGTWTTPASYPGEEAVWVNEGLINYHDACAVVPGGFQGNFTDIFYGSTTEGGYEVFPVDESTVPTRRLLDLASNFTHPIGMGFPIVPPVLGSVRQTQHLIYTNIP
jgi:hypothetical protein